MRIYIFLAFALLAFTVPAAADFSTVTQAYEVSLRDLRLPYGTHGTLGFKPCDTCASQTVRVRASTRYVLNGRTVTLDTLKAKVGVAKGRRDAAVTILHHLESNLITKVKVRL